MQPAQRALWWVIWPGFIAACVAEFVFFALFDPLDFNVRLHLSREAVYTWGFIAFWLLGVLSSGITLFLGGSFVAGGRAFVPTPEAEGNDSDSDQDGRPRGA